MFEELSRIQHDFDVSRGFAELPFAPGGGGEDNLAKLEYALIGMTGEVGEIANILKRARRSSAQGEPGMGLVELQGEIADVLAYLLKFAGLAGINPAEAYLMKMCLNAHRFQCPGGEPPRTLTLCGPPGSGKTTLAELLALDYPEWAVYKEGFRDNPHLRVPRDAGALFDADASQSWFLGEMAAFLRSDPVPPIVLDQDPTAIPLVYGHLLVDDGRLEPAAFQRHLMHLMRLEIDHASILANRRVVLLDAPPEVLASRCAEKFAEVAMPAFLERAHVRFREVFGDLPGTVIVDCSGPIEVVLKEVSRVAAEMLQKVS